MIVLNHPMIRVVSSSTFYEVEICMQNGTWVRHEPFPLDQRGLVAAISLAVDVLAGKFWLKEIVKQSEGWKAPLNVRLEGAKQC